MVIVFASRKTGSNKNTLIVHLTQAAAAKRVLSQDRGFEAGGLP
jgi:hypothetical protein